MKRVIIYILVAAFSLFPIEAQHPRTPILEEFTSSTCPPCATAKPIVAQFAQQRKDAVVITYHEWWPRPGDPYNVYNSVNDTVRVNYYNVTGIPAAFMNGRTVSISLQSLNQAADAEKAKGSPLHMTISEDRSTTPYRVTVTIKNDGSSTISGATLRTMVVNYYADLTTQLQGQTQHVYTTFDYAQLAELPNTNGTALTLAAGEQKQFTFTYTKYNHYIWTSPYVIAFVQIEPTREIIQAATSLKLNHVEIASNMPQFGLIGRGGTKQHAFTVHNPTDVLQTVSLSINTSGSLIPTGWSADVNPKTITLQPGQTQNVTVEYSAAPGSGGFILGQVKITMTTQNNYTNQADQYYTSGYLVDDTKHALIYGYMGSGIVPFIQAIQSHTQVSQDLALMPAAAMAALSPLPCTTVMIPIDYNGRGYLGSRNSDLITYVNSLVTENKRLFLYGQIEAYFAFQTSSYNPQARHFFQNVLGIQDVYTQRLSDGSVIPYHHLDANFQQIMPFSVQGRSNDPISNGLNFQCNGTQYPNPYGDVLRLSTNPANKVTPIFSYDNNPNNISGIRVETPSTRLVYLTFGLEAINNSSIRNQVAQRILDWLTQPLARMPRLEFTQTTSQNTIEFGRVRVGESKPHTFAIRNTGDTTLVISGIVADDQEFAQVFPITSGASLPITIQPGQQHQLTIEFRPKKVEDLQVVVYTFQSNAGEAQLTVYGDGIQGSSVAPSDVAYNGLALRISPNPVSTDARISYSVSSGRKAELILVDTRGLVVSRLASIDSSGDEEHSLRFDPGIVANGVYRLILRSGTDHVSIPIVVAK